MIIFLTYQIWVLKEKSFFFTVFVSLFAPGSGTKMFKIQRIRILSAA